MLYAGVKKLTDFQDPAYADEYLTEVAKLHAADKANGGAEKDFAFTAQAAKYVAIAMAYDDVIRVADLKTRGSRFDRVKKEVGVKADQILYTTEYMHPRMEEVCGTLPKGLGSFIENRPALFNWLNRRIDKGRRVKTGTLFWLPASMSSRRSAASAAAASATRSKWRIAMRGSGPHSTSCRRTTTSPSRSSATAVWSRAIPTPMSAASPSSTASCRPCRC